MACTTTATTTYPLLKYSRSYPSANATNTSAADWQHFTNPVLRLILDVTKTEKSELYFIRLRIIWTIQNGGVITVNDNSEIEDVDLLAFSSLQPRQGTFMNIPLKAVYRDTTVGIRYLHPLDATNTTNFRRFQVSFASESETNTFINSIRSVCPCKMSLAAPAPSATQQQSQIPGGIKPGSYISLPQQLPSGYNFAPVSSVQESQHSFGSSLPGSQPSIVLSGRYTQSHLEGNIAGPCPSVIDTSQLLSMPPPPVQSQPQSLHRSSSSLDLDATGDPIGSQIKSAQQQLTQATASSQTYTAPSSSQVSAPQDTSMESEKATNRQIEHTAAHPIISALKEATYIYGLSLDDLERAVGDIIREDGFISLVEKMDQLWKIKSLIRRD